MVFPQEGHIVDLEYPLLLSRLDQPILLVVVKSDHAMVEHTENRC